MKLANHIIVAIAAISHGGMCLADAPIKDAHTHKLAATLHQRLYKDASRRMAVSEARTQALDEYLRTAQGLTENAGSDELRRAETQLVELEKHLGNEGLQVGLLEDLEELKTLLPLLADQERQISFGKNVATLNGELQVADVDLNTSRIAVRELQRDLIDTLDLPWQPGAGTLSFGRFGYHKTDGLLCDNISLGPIQANTTSESGKTITIAAENSNVVGCVATFPTSGMRVSLAPPGLSSEQSEVAAVDWIGKRLNLRSADGTPLGAVLTNLQRLSTRFVFLPKSIKCGLERIEPEHSFVYYCDSDGWHKHSLAEQINLSLSNTKKLSRPWIMIDALDTSSGQWIPIVLQFQKRLASIQLDHSTCVMTSAAESLGSIWLFRPLGVARRRQPVSQSANPPGQLIDRIDKICSLNLAWPTTCHEFFRIDDGRQTIIIRNDVEFELVQDDWSTLPDPQVAVPPLVMLGREFGTPLDISGALIEWNIPTKYGPYATVSGHYLEYRIPAAPLYRHGLFAVKQQQEIVEEINRCVFYTTADYPSLAHEWPAGRVSVDWAYKGVAAALMAFGYLNEEKHAYLEDATRDICAHLNPKRFWRDYKWRIEPLSNRRYCYDYPRQYYKADPVHDIDWGNGLTLYGLDVWAAHTGNWQDIERAWQQIWAMLDFLRKSHDWAWMSHCVLENGRGTGIDCLPGGYVGWVATVRMAEALGHSIEADKALYLCSKTALTHALRFSFLQYVQQHDLWQPVLLPDRLGALDGFNEHSPGWSYGADHGLWFPACSLSGYSVDPECYDAILAYAGPMQIRHWWDMIQRMYPRWYDGSVPRSQYRVSKFGNSRHSTLPLIYLEMRLGTPTEQLLEYEGQHHGNLDGSWKVPNVLGAIASRPCPVMLTRWEPCILAEPVFDLESGTARVGIENPTAAARNVLLKCRELPVRVSLNGAPARYDTTRDVWQSNIVSVSIAPGRHELQLAYVQ